jgi:excisionase family DNA binding protein
LLSTREAARYLRVSEASIRRWSDSGLLPASRIGRRRARRFGEGDLRAFLEHEGGPSEAAPPAARAILMGGESVPLHSHLASFYADDAGRLRLALPFYSECLRAGDSCFLFSTGDIRNRYLESLAEEGLDLDAAIGDGTLVLLSPWSSAAEGLAYTEELFNRAMLGKSRLLRIVSETVCVRQWMGAEDQFAYEEALNVFARRFPMVCLCQHDAREFDGAALLRAMKMHADLFALHLGRFLG